jgi:hypothetical protein
VQADGGIEVRSSEVIRRRIIAIVDRFRRGLHQIIQLREAILLKCYDSKDDGRARFTAHTAFDDPNSPPNAAARESIEVRALVFWPLDVRPTPARRRDSSFSSINASKRRTQE